MTMGTDRLEAPTLVLLLTLLSLGVGGCAHQRAKTARDAAAATAPTPPAASDASEPVVRDDVLHAVEELKPVHFGYDSDILTPEDRAILRRNAAWMKKQALARFQAAGHCDQRGTVEYNLALGQRRAKAVRDYLTKLGVDGRRIATISYGKEKPLCREMEPACWQRNRRAETLVAFPETVSSARQGE